MPLFYEISWLLRKHFLPFLYTQPDVERASARCCRIVKQTGILLFQSLFFFFILFRLFDIVFVHSVGYLEFCRINRRRSVFVEFFEGEEIWPWIKTDYFVRGYSLVFHFWKRSVHRAWDVVFACVYMYIYTCMVRSAFLHALSSIEPGFSCLVYCISMVISEVVLYKWRGSFLLVEAMVDNRKYTLILYYRF